MMKKGLALLFLLCFVLGCTTFNEDLKGFKNCGENEECITASLQSCEKAYAFEIHEDVLTKETWIFVVYGEEEGNCKFAIKLYNVEGKNEEGKIRSALMPPFLKINEMECAFPKELVSEFEEFEGETARKYCTGPMFSLMDKFEENPDLFKDNPFSAMGTPSN